jgi:hypothetical protein
MGTERRGMFDMGSPDMGNSRHAGVETVFEGDGQIGRGGGKSYTVGDFGYGMNVMIMTWKSRWWLEVQLNG